MNKSILSLTLSEIISLKPLYKLQPFNFINNPLLFFWSHFMGLHGSINQVFFCHEVLLRCSKKKKVSGDLYDIITNTFMYFRCKRPKHLNNHEISGIPTYKKVWSI